jgi:pimeloyl-ACP methyl ester carboxylesterase
MIAAPPKTFVLVHGAWHGGWCFSRVAALLRLSGHIVYTPTLTGLGERSHLYSPAINASTHVQDIVNVIEFEDLEDVILVGHSYAGQIITKVADTLPERVAQLVYLDGYVGEDGKSSLDMDLPESVSAHLDRAQANGGHTIPPVPAAAFGVNATDQDWVNRMCRAQPFATLAERLALTGRYLEVQNKGYVLATGWNASPFRVVYDKIKGQPDWRCHELPCGHDVMIDMPKETSAILDAWSQNTGAPRS